MLRPLLGTLFLLSSSFPALAENLVCSYKHVRGYRPAPITASPSPIVQAIEPFNPMVLSVFYPGLIVLMTMMAYYFLKVMEPQARHNEPQFVRSATMLSGLWLVGFLPFLSSAIGGFLFCVTGMACVGGWLLMRRYAGQVRFRERLLVFWSFFFFSLVTALIATGHGFGIGPFFEFAWQAGKHLAREAGPLLLMGVNIGAFFLALRIVGMKVPRPREAETITRIKIIGLALSVIVLDVTLINSHYTFFAWLPALLFALPALAYYGVYWLARRLPDNIRGRVSLSLFSLLSLFLILLASVSAGASPREMLAAALTLCLGVSVAGCLGLLWRTDVAQFWKLFTLGFFAAAFTGAGWVLVTLDELPLEAQDVFIREQILLGWLSHKAAVPAIAGLYGLGLLLLVARKTFRAKMALAGTMLFSLILLSLCLPRAMQAAEGLYGPAGDAIYAQPVPYDTYVKECVKEK